MQYAGKLRKGDKVAIVSLSSGMLGEEFCSHNIEIGVKRLKEYGLDPVFMPNALKGIEYLKAHPEARAKDLKDGCKALCEWEILGISDNYVFFKLFPQTGKTHQLRIQLSNMGFPVKGDLKYGSKRSDSLPGIRLHCHSIKFPLMNCNREITVESLPRYSDNLWNYFYDLYYGKRK